MPFPQTEPEIVVAFPEPIKDAQGHPAKDFIYRLDSPPFDVNGETDVQFGCNAANHWMAVKAGPTVEKTFKRALRLITARYAGHAKVSIRESSNRTPHPPADPYFDRLKAVFSP